MEVSRGRLRSRRDGRKGSTWRSEQGHSLGTRPLGKGNNPYLEGTGNSGGTLLVPLKTPAKQIKVSRNVYSRKTSGEHMITNLTDSRMGAKRTQDSRLKQESGKTEFQMREAMLWSHILKLPDWPSHTQHKPLW